MSEFLNQGLNNDEVPINFFLTVSITNTPSPSYSKYFGYFFMCFFVILSIPLTIPWLNSQIEPR